MMSVDDPTRRPLPNRTPWGRGANWTVGLAAAVLLAISLGGYWYHREQLASLAAEHLRLMVIGPAALQPGIAADYSVSTTAVTGAAMPAQVEFALYAPDGKRLPWGHKEKSDERGRLQVTIPAELKVPSGTRLEVLAVHRDNLERVETLLAVEPARYATQLTLDKPAYRPGDTLRYRSVTLSRFGLAADRETTLHFEILAPGGGVVAGSPMASVTRHGIGSGSLTLPAELADGRYTLVARSNDAAVREERQTFLVRRDRLPRLNVQLELARDRYAPGDKVVADLLAERVDDGPAAAAPLHIVASVDGRQIFEKTTKTDNAGARHIEFTLPEQIERGDGQLLAVIDDGGTRETAARAIPIDLGKVEVAFYPEGGNLVANLENRVYFAARNALGEPVSVKGMVVDGSGANVALLETTYAGMGSFSFMPLAREKYRLKITSPGGAKNEPRLPQVSADRKVVLTTGTGIFAAGEPLEFNVRAAKPNLPLVIAAVCRGVLVGQQAFVTSGENNGANPVVIPLNDQAGGVIRLTAYDYSVSPPRAVAERLVYRKLPRQLNVVASGSKEHYTPGEKVEMTVRVTNEKGESAPADLGIAVVDQSLVKVAGDGAPAMTTHFLLGTEIERPEDLPQADFYLSDSPEARVALDLLLGTQNGRRFIEAAPGEAAQDGHSGEQPNGLVAGGGRSLPPLVFDNLKSIHDNYQESLAAYRADRTNILNTLTTASFFGGLGLVLLVAMLGLLKIVSGIHLWVPAVGTTVCCLIIGAVLMDPNRLRPGQEAAVPFVPFHLTPEAVASMEKAASSAEEQAAADKSAKPRDAEDDRKLRGAAPRDADARAEPAETLFWRPLLESRDGRANISFDLPDSPATFRVLVDAHGRGRIGAGRAEIVSRIPFGMAAQVPPELSAGDRIDVPLNVVNESPSELPLDVRLEHGDLVKLAGPPQRKLVLPPGKHIREYFALDAIGEKGEGELIFRGTTGRLADALTRPLRVVPPGFPKNLSRSGYIDGPQQVAVDLPESWAPGSLEITLHVFPSALADLQCGLESVLSEPGGCFEQAATMSYLSALSLEYMREHNVGDPAIIRRAKHLLAKGDAQRAAYECKQRGYEWFGGEPAHEALSAYALMQLSDMAKVYDVDAAIVKRTADWLLDRRDGKGGFLRNSRALDALAAAPQETSDAYIIWALSESGQKGIDAEVAHLIDAAAPSADPYLIALAAATAINAGISAEGKSLLDKLAESQADDGSLAALEQGSITRSGGQSLQVETTALGALAWLKVPTYTRQAGRAIRWLVSHRQGSGGFGSTQATLLALRALLEQAKANRAPATDGKLIVKRDGQLIAQRPFATGRQEVITIDGLETSLHPGTNRLNISLSGENKMPYALDVRYRDSKPPNDKNCPLRLETHLAKTQVKAGETVALMAEVSNTSDQAQPMTIAILGLPAGVEPRSEALEELKKSGTIDYYETRAREIICYWRALPPLKKVPLELDLLCSVPGKFTAPPSQAYLYYTPEQKQWSAPLTLEITRE